MLSPLHRTHGLLLSKARRTAKHTEEGFDTCIGLPCAITGKRYFEVIINLNRGGIIAGWTLEKDRYNKEIGAEAFSWGISSYFGNKGTKDKWTQYAQKMKNGDCIGCIVDTKNRTISFTLNGIGSGVAFKNIPPGPYYPGISLKHKKTNVTVNFGTAPFKFLPADCLPLTHMPEAIEKETKIADAAEEENRKSKVYSKLIPEIVVHMFTFLDAKSLASAAMTSRLWAKFAAEVSVWEKVYRGMLQMSLSKEVEPSKYKSRCSSRYNLETAESNIVQVFPCKAIPECLQFDDSKLICGAGEVLAIFEDCFDDEKVLTRRRVTGHNGAIKDLQFNDSTLVTISDDQTIKIWDVDDYDCSATISFAYDGGVNNVRFHDHNLYSYRGYTTLSIYDMNTLKSVWTNKYDQAPGEGNAVMDLSDDGRTLIFASSKIMVLDTRSRTLVHSYSIESDFITLCHGVTKEGLVCCWKDGTFAQYDVFASGEPVFEFEGSTYGMTCVYSDSGYVAAGFEDCDVKLWDIKSGNLVTEIRQACILQPTCIQFDEGKVICGSRKQNARRHSDTLFWTFQADQIRILFRL
eukprot:Phypoly_transcript_04486.p1 GENE.Phypoly_transcript_04486~~Phypoly_transcript_04486.p1  ORF type:complete len:575 (+),score=57.04 Phypoly_transcript_04486:111-1835(+)